LTGVAGFSSHQMQYERGIVLLTCFLLARELATVGIVAKHAGYLPAKVTVIVAPKATTYRQGIADAILIH
jgi:hypothetical protein